MTYVEVMPMEFHTMIFTAVLHIMPMEFHTMIFTAVLHIRLNCPRTQVGVVF